MRYCMVLCVIVKNKTIVIRKPIEENKHKAEYTLQEFKNQYYKISKPELNYKTGDEKIKIKDSIKY